MATKFEQPAPEPRFAERLFEAHLRQLKRLIESRGMKGVRTLYRQVQSDLIDRLKSFGPMSSKPGAVELRAMLAQVDAVLELGGQELRQQLQDVTSAAANMGAQHGVKEFKVLQYQFAGTTPVLDLDRASIFQGMVEEIESSLLRRHQHAASNWTTGAISRMEQSLSVGVMSGKPLGELVNDVVKSGGLAEEQRWRAERIVRTESAYAHGASKFFSIQKTAEELGDDRLQKRLIETFDDRTGDDSFLLHGQTVPVNKPFEWKHKLAGNWVVEQYQHPPNRPNDRAVMIPWDPSWEDTTEEAPLTRSELQNAMPTRWRKHAGVQIPPGHKPGKPYRRTA